MGVCNSVCVGGGLERVKLLWDPDKKKGKEKGSRLEGEREKKLVLPQGSHPRALQYGYLAST